MMTNIQKTLFDMQDISYKEFHSKLMPTVPCEKVIGVRTPLLRKYAKELSDTDEAETFLTCLAHEYYEENNLHAFLICRIKDFDTALSKTLEFVPYIDNWATCDMFVPPVFRKNREKLYPHILNWIASGKTYSVRYGIGLLLNLYLDDCFDKAHPEIVCAVKSDEYYVNMMRAWYFATALAKKYDDVIHYIEERKLDIWTHNKTIRKCIESYRITDEQKKYLRTLAVKK
jgi:3-methyladenine DNA glycosylase AlkD